MESKGALPNTHHSAAPCASYLDCYCFMRLKVFVEPQSIPALRVLERPRALNIFSAANIHSFAPPLYSDFCREINTVIDKIINGNSHQIAIGE